MTQGPVLFDIDEGEGPSPAEAAPVPDTIPPGMVEGAAMQTVAQVASRGGSGLARWFWGLAVAIVGFVASVAAYDFAAGLMARSPILGWVATGLLGLFCVILAGIALRELAAFGRLRRIDRIQRSAQEVLLTRDLKAAQSVTDDVLRLYAGREDTRLGREEVRDRRKDILDADDVLGLTEDRLLAALDQRATREVEAAARQVATVTAIVPLALADVIAALTSNLRMIRRIAEIYGGRAGTLGSWRLTRTVFTHLVATGAVAVGDDLIGSVAGGGVLSKLSRRFGEGVINGALTARVGVAAIEVCRPLPFERQARPSVSGIVSRALSGLFGRPSAE